MASVVRDDESVVSVGTSIHNGGMYTTQHPLYLEYSKLIEQEISAQVDTESARKAACKQAVVTAALPATMQTALEHEYPEFRVEWLNESVPVHALFTARRQLAGQFMTHHLKSMAATYVHYGGSTLSYLAQGVVDATLMLDRDSAVATQEAHSDDLLSARLLEDRERFAKEGLYVSPEAAQRYYDGALWRKRVDPADMTQADALIVDGTLHALPPQQFALAMAQHGASVGMFCMPYHASMHMQDTGELPDTGVKYNITESDVEFWYPEAVAGVSTYSRSCWNEWLVNTYRVAPTKSGGYHFELMGARGCLMFIRVVYVERVPAKQEFVHVLSLPEMGRNVKVVSWRLRNVAARVTSRDAWVRVEITAPARVVEKAYEYAMTLEKGAFSRSALRKRLAILNDRITVEGTTVKVNTPMTAEALDVLEAALFTRAFVDRYKHEQLASTLRQRIDASSRFATMGERPKYRWLISTLMVGMYGSSIRAFESSIRSALDRVIDSEVNRVDRTEMFVPMPQFLRYDTMFRRRGNVLEQCLSTLKDGVLRAADSLFNWPGVHLAHAFGTWQESDPVKWPLAPVVDEKGFAVHDDVLFSDVVDSALGTQHQEAHDRLVGQIKLSNTLDQTDGTRHFLQSVTYATAEEEVDMVSYSFDPGYIDTLNELHEMAFPGMAAVDSTYDPSSLATDDQHRTIQAPYLDMPGAFNTIPKDMSVYRSKFKGYQTTKRPQNAQEVLSAVSARNLAAPVLALPQDQPALIRKVWQDFKDQACVSNVDELLAGFSRDRVALEEEMIRDWASKARPENVEKTINYLIENPSAWEEFRVERYEAMIKTDVKPPLSEKPKTARVEPQVIVHHMTHVNAFFSSVFRVLTRRFLSLLKPNYMLYLLKDIGDAAKLIQRFHDWHGDVKWLENDFSKYDKAQQEFVHELEAFVFEELGLDFDMLAKWKLGHIDCSIRSVAIGLSLNLRYQRKSGDATTSLGNGILNIVSVCHAYKGSDIVWAVFMGDDSLVEVRTLVDGQRAVATLAEVFNLQAKFFITTAPYFASSFVRIDPDQRTVRFLPDPMKLVEKLSVAVPARDPGWDDRFQSAVDRYSVYRNVANATGLDLALLQRYPCQEMMSSASICDAIASLIRSVDDFRNGWEKYPEIISY